MEMVAPINASLLVLRSDFERWLRCGWPHDRFHPEHTADWLASLAHDVIANGAVIGLVEDQLPEINLIPSLDHLLIVDRQFLLKRESGSSIWAVCERNDSPVSDRFLNNHVNLLQRLRSHVKHPIDQQYSFHLINRQLRDLPA
jgi:hypothetical protein